MLVITRKIGQCANIGQNLTVKLLWTKGRTAGIGINAPLDVAILRDDAKNTKPNVKVQSKDGNFQGGESC